MPLRILCLVLLAALSAMASGCHMLDRLTPAPFRDPHLPKLSRSQALADLQQAYPCCNSYADFSYRMPLAAQLTRYRLGPSSPVANLGGERTHFLAFQLPYDRPFPYQIAFKAEINGRWMSKSYIFAPSVTLLDAAFQPLESHDLKLCEYMSWSRKKSGAFASLDIKTSQARYLLVYTSKAQLAANTYWEQSPASFSNDQSLSMSNDSSSSLQIPHGPDGSIWVGLSGPNERHALKHALCGKPKDADGLLNGLGWP